MEQTDQNAGETAPLRGSQNTPTSDAPTQGTPTPDTTPPDTSTPSAPPPDASTQKPAPTPSPAKVLARVLVDCEHGIVNEVVSLTARAARVAERLGLISTHADSVAYAQGLDKKSGG
jgi:hypothetical protein